MIPRLNIVDTSYLIALLLQKDKYHNEAKLSWNKFKTTEDSILLLNDYVIDEVLTLVLKRTKNCDVTEIASQTIDKLIAENVFEFYKIQERDYNSAKNIFIKYCDKYYYLCS
ncbi:MAG: hypothetical protein OEZ01_08320 [Candidatus Heimdallarchaeota archaeon]|nr:hypothetical protein [Candidatus Heimdallarchaeota archaeon]MDH5645998.1 hypothetical protein [Candidatus Heimdallarchaeota archaeon]